MITLPTINAVRRRLKEKGCLTLGYLYYELEDYEKSIKYLENISSNENGADALLGIGWSAIKLNDYRRAILALEELVRRFPQSIHIPEANFLLGQSYLKLEAYKGAINYFSKILKMFPKTRDTRRVQDEVKLEIDKQKKKIEQIRVSLLIMESKFLNAVVPRDKDVPNYLTKETKKSEKTREDLLKSLIRERKNFDRLTQDLTQLKKTVRVWEIDWRSYAEYGITRALFLKSKRQR